MFKDEVPPAKTTRERILREAFFLVYEKGAHGASIEAICAQIGITKGAFFYYFKSKKSLLSALISEVIQGIGYQRYIVPMLENDDPVEGLRAVVLGMNVLNGEYEAKHGCILTNLMMELGRKDADLHRELLKLFEGWIGHVETVIERAVREGRVNSEIQPARFARWFVSSFQGAIQLGQFFQSLDLSVTCFTELAEAVSRYLEAGTGDPLPSISRRGEVMLHE